MVIFGIGHVWVIIQSMVIEQLKTAHPTVYVLAVTAVFVATKITPVAWRYARMIYSVAKAIERLSALPDRFDALLSEVKPNGGSSLRDAVDRTSRKIDEVNESLVRSGVRSQIRWKMASGIAGWESDAAGRCTAANSDLCEMLKMGESEILGSNWKNFVHPEDSERVFREWARVVSEAADFNLLARYIASDGNIISVRLKAHVMMDGGRVIGWIGVAEFT